MPNHRGASLAVCFDSTLLHIVSGHSPDDNLRKCPGGKFDAIDQALSEQETALNCVIRELRMETGLTEEHLQLGFIPIHTRTAGTRHEPFMQYSFLTVLHEGVILPKHSEEELEIGDIKFEHIDTVLRNVFLRKGNVERFNPYHSQALVRCLFYLRKTIAGDNAFRNFNDCIKNIKGLDTYIDEVTHKTRTGQL